MKRTGGGSQTRGTMHPLEVTAIRGSRSCAGSNPALSSMSCGCTYQGPIQLTVCCPEHNVAARNIGRGQVLLIQTEIKYEKALAKFKGQRTKRALRTELRRVERMIKFGRRKSTWDFPFLEGAQQALAWALGGNANAPRRCV